jgi:hypothetical protein
MAGSDGKPSPNLSLVRERDKERQIWNRLQRMLHVKYGLQAAFRKRICSTMEFRIRDRIESSLGEET